MPGRPSSQGDSQEPKTLPYNDDDDDQIARRPIHYHVQAKLKDREGGQDDLGKTIIGGQVVWRVEDIWSYVRQRRTQ